MKPTVPQQLIAYFRANAGKWIASGEVQRLQWRNKNGTTAVPRSIVRRLQELCEEGTLKEEIRDRHAWYSYAKEVRERKIIQCFTEDGRPYIKEVYETTH